MEVTGHGVLAKENPNKANDNPHEKYRSQYQVSYICDGRKGF